MLHAPFLLPGDFSGCDVDIDFHGAAGQAREDEGRDRASGEVGRDAGAADRSIARDTKKQQRWRGEHIDAEETDGRVRLDFLLLPAGRGKV